LYILVSFEQRRTTGKMANIDAEEKQYQQEVEEVKKWWSDSRWRYTRRPFTAEQIVQKRGTLRLQYPSNALAKKLWNIVEGRFKVSHFLPSVLIPANQARTTM
jgi:isocitrate lyase